MSQIKDLSTLKDHHKNNMGANAEMNSGAATMMDRVTTIMMGHHMMDHQDFTDQEVPVQEDMVHQWEDQGRQNAFPLFNLTSWPRQV